MAIIINGHTLPEPVVIVNRLLFLVVIAFLPREGGQAMVAELLPGRQEARGCDSSKTYDRIVILDKDRAGVGVTTLYHLELVVPENGAPYLEILPLDR